MSKLLRYEQETIINFNAGEKMATVYTADPAVIRNLDSLVIEYPDTFKCVKVNDISKTYEMPKTSVTYRKPIRLFDDHREQARQKMNNINFNKESTQCYL